MILFFITTGKSIDLSHTRSNFIYSFILTSRHFEDSPLPILSIGELCFLFRGGCYLIRGGSHYRGGHLLVKYYWLSIGFHIHFYSYFIGTYYSNIFAFFHLRGGSCSHSTGEVTSFCGLLFGGLLSSTLEEDCYDTLLLHILEHLHSYHMWHASLFIW